MADDEAGDDVGVRRRGRSPASRLGMDGTVYVATGGGGSRYANSIVALDGKTLKLKDWMQARLGVHLHAGRLQRRR